MRLKVCVLYLPLFTLALLCAPVAAQAAGNHTGAVSASYVNKPVAQSLIKSLSQATSAGLSFSQAPSQNDLKLINGPRLAHGNKVGLFYLGADFCPYCAGQRWPLVLTLLRFGHITGLKYMLSSSDDVFPDTPTFSFYKSTYQSKYVDFIPVETQTRTHKPLQKPTKAQNAIFTKFDAPPYTQYFGGIPFVYLDGQYVLNRPMLLPDKLQGMNWAQIASALNDTGSTLFQKVMPQVNLLTAAICRMDGGNPDNVCSAPGVTEANGDLLKMQMTH